LPKASSRRCRRADVLVFNDRKPEAETLLQTTLRDAPQSALAHETMGSRKFREGDIPAARKWYGEAVQLNSQSFLAQYYSAVLAMQSGDTTHPDAIESSLKLSIQLNPKFAESYDARALLCRAAHQAERGPPAQSARHPIGTRGH
jgi:predicted Zn-dependent protease